MLELGIYDDFFSYPSKMTLDDFKKTFDEKNQYKYYLMKNNFSRFWYELNLELRKKYLELANINQGSYNQLNNLIRYVYDLEIGQIDNLFFQGQCKDLNFDIENETVKQYYRFNHNISGFWSNLTPELKLKFINLVQSHEFTIGETINDFSYNYTEFDFENSHKNLDIIKRFNKYKSPDGIEVSFHTQIDVDNFTSDNKKINIHSFGKNKITSINNLPEGLEELYTNCEYVNDYNNLPQTLRKFTCVVNESVELNNLPNELEELDVSSNYNNKLIKNLPNSLKILKSSRNNVEEIINMPDNLMYLDLDENNISKLKNLPNKLIYLIAKRNSISKIENLPSGIEYLDLSYNKISILEGIPEPVQYLNLEKNLITQIDITNPNILYLNCGFNKITNISGLPNNLQYLILDYNEKIYEINHFPSSLKYLSINCCGFESFENIPTSLEYLALSGNNFSQLVIPQSVKYLLSSYNKNLTMIELPLDLKYLNIESSGITNLENLPDSIVVLDISSTLIKNITLPSKLRKLYVIDCDLEVVHNYHNRIEEMDWDIEKSLFYIFPNNLETTHGGGVEIEKDFILPYGVSIRKTQDLYYKYIEPLDFNKL